jgi:hypothetical protein
MRHMGNSGKLAVTAAVVALLMLVLTALTLEEAVMLTFLGLVGLAYVAALFEVLSRRRHAVAVATGLGTSLTIAFSLAFVSTWELAYANQSSIIGTPLPTGDPDNYFFLAAASAVATLLVLFLGASWPAVRRLRAVKRKPAWRPGSASGRPGARGSAGNGASRRPAAAGRAVRNAAGQRTSGSPTSGSRAPARLPGAAAKRPSSAGSGRTPSSSPRGKAPSRR